MTKFLVFDFSQYYPGGGLDDCTGIFDTIEEAQAVGHEHILEIPALLVHAHGEVCPLNFLMALGGKACVKQS